MLFDFKKEYREFYLPKGTPELVTVPPMTYLTAEGVGDPNEENGAYQQAVGQLYTLAYTLKMSYKTPHAIAGFYEYVVPPLEGFWRQDGTDGMDYAHKERFRWLSVIRVPEFITAEDVAWAKAEALRKKKADCADVRLQTIDEGLCVQCMHLGAFDDEPATVARMDAFALANGCVNDFSDARQHHEIYLSDPRKSAVEHRKTVIRHPVRKG